MVKSVLVNEPQLLSCSCMEHFDQMLTKLFAESVSVFSGAGEEETCLDRLPGVG